MCQFPRRKVRRAARRTCAAISMSHHPSRWVQQGLECGNLLDVRRLPPRQLATVVVSAFDTWKVTIVPLNFGASELGSRAVSKKAVACDPFPPRRRLLDSGRREGCPTFWGVQGCAMSLPFHGSAGVRAQTNGNVNGLSPNTINWRLDLPRRSSCSIPLRSAKKAENSIPPLSRHASSSGSESDRSTRS
jgi:hypothetical protein